VSELVAGTQGRPQCGEIDALEDRADATSPAVNAGGADLPELLAYGFDQTAHDDPGLLDVRLAANPEGSGDRQCGARGSGRGHETWPDLRLAMGLFVMIRSEVRLHEVLGDPLGDVVRRKIGEDAACDRSQVGQRGHHGLRHRPVRAVAGVAGLDRLQDQPLHVERGVVDWKAERFGVGQVLAAACRHREVPRPGG
jgi:hypothetical protein